MVVKIRLARCGQTHLPHYRINVANSFNKRDGRFIEKLGHYCPIPDKYGCKIVTLDYERTKYWLSVGAQPTDTVASLLFMAGLLPPRPKLVKWKNQESKGGEKKQVNKCD